MMVGWCDRRRVVAQCSELYRKRRRTGCDVGNAKFGEGADHTGDPTYKGCKLHDHPPQQSNRVSAI